MKKPQQFLHLLALGLLSSWIFFVAGCTNLKHADAPTTITNTNTGNTLPSNQQLIHESAYVPPAAPENLWDELINGYAFPDVEDAKVGKHLRWFSNNQKYIDRVTEQSKPYMHYVMTQLQENDMPLELALLPIVESAYDPFVVSPSKAAGIWQFVPQTARNFGLKNNNLYDGRRDIVASTDAAVRYLKRLHIMFNNDWLLAIAAYNAGEGTVRRAIEANRKQGRGTDFWSLPLSQQTQSYVPQLVALSKIVAAPEKYDLTLNQIPNNPYFTRINVNTPIDLAQAARMAEMDPKELRQLNAGYSKWITDPHGPHELLVPIADAAEFTLTLNSLPKLTHIPTTNDYAVKPGDTLGSIAKRFGTNIADIQSLNRLTNGSLKIGQHLQIPGQGTLVSQYVAVAEQEIAARNNKNTHQKYTVKSGDSFWTIAKSHGISISSLLKWNELTHNSKLKPGQQLLVVNTQSTIKDTKITYQIKNGDTLMKIATKFDVTKKDILNWNKVKDESYIHPGQELTIYLTAQK